MLLRIVCVKTLLCMAACCALTTSASAYDLTINIAGEGSVTLDPPGGTYDPGTSVTLTGNAESEWEFYWWIVDAGTPSETRSRSNPLSIVMNADRVVTAVFVPTIPSANVRLLTDTSPCYRAGGPDDVVTVEVSLDNLSEPAYLAEVHLVYDPLILIWTGTTLNLPSGWVELQDDHASGTIDLAAATFTSPIEDDHTIATITFAVAGEPSCTAGLVDFSASLQTLLSVNGPPYAFEPTRVPLPLISVEDDEPPVIAACPTDIDVLCLSDLPAAATDLAEFEAQGGVVSDNCGVVYVSHEGDSALVNKQITRTYRVVDRCANEAFCDQVITFTDAEPPTFAGCPANIVVENDTGECNAMVTWTPPTANDNCDGAVTPVGTHSPGDTFAVGTTAVAYTATDALGNESICTFNVTVNDTEDPSITCPSDITVANDAGVCQAAVTVPVPTTGDNCGVASVTNDFNGTADASGTYPVGTTTVTWTVTDTHNNTNQCTMDVTVNDTENPSITCPDDITTDNDPGVCEAAVTVPAPTTGDNCGVASVTNDFNDTADASGTYPVGTTTVTWTVTDTHGNTSQCTMDVTVNDTEDPSITCPSDITVANDPGVCEAAVTVPAPTTGDNCGVASVTNDFNDTADASGTYPVGTTTVTWTVTDTHGNTDQCTMDVTVNDTEAPAVTSCPPDQVVAFDAQCVATLPDLTGLVEATDNCATNLILTQDPAVGEEISTPTLVTITIGDGNGNESDCQLTLTPEDQTPPEITTCPADRILPALADCAATIPDLTGEVEATDNCDTDLTITQDPAVGTLITTQTTVTITVTDDALLTATCPVVVTPEDGEDPVITVLPPDQDVAVDDNCQALLPDLTGGVEATDNCDDDLTITQDPSAGTPITTPTTVTIAVTDDNGNFASDTVLVTPTDGIAPVVSGCPTDQTIAYDGSCTATLPDLTVGVSGDDNCDVDVTITQVPPAGTAITTPTLVTITVSDSGGNESECALTVTPEDQTPPVITQCAADQALAAGADCTAAVPDLTGEIVATDNCDATPAITQNPTAGTVITGPTLVLITATDAAGNTDECTATLTIVDETPPTITACAPDQDVIADANCEALVPDLTGAVTAEDNCDPNPTITQDPLAGSLMTDDTLVTISVVDSSSNEAQCYTVLTLADNLPPTITCPPDIDVNADAGGCTATLDAAAIGMPAVADNCTAMQDIAVTWTRSDGATNLTEPFDSADSPIAITWTATDEDGNADDCVQYVTVAEWNEVDVEIWLPGSTPATRCIHFVTDVCSAFTDTPIDFVQVVPGEPVRAIVTLTVPCGDWLQLCAKDEQHTLWNTVALTQTGSVYTASDDLLLIGGDTDNDGDVDAEDVSWFIYQYGTLAVDGDCPPLFPGQKDADFDNDGMVDTDDYTFLSFAWNSDTDCACSNASGNLGGAQPWVHVDALPAHVARAVDLNHDDRMDYEDVRLFESRNGLPHRLSDRMARATSTHSDVGHADVRQ
jgi:hypothetical protein